MKAKAADTMALVIDYQERLMPSIEGQADLAVRSAILLQGLKALEVPMIITQQYTKGLGMSAPFVYDSAGSREYMEKTTFSCLGDEKINHQVKAVGRKNVIVCGVEAHICVLQTCLDLKEQGYHPMLVVDCIGSRKRSDYDTAITRAVQEGITITTYESVLFELLQQAGGTTFKKISNLIK